MGRAFQNRKESMAKTAAAKTKVYSKYGREIYVCAKQGGVDPHGNLALRGLIERAKKDQVPSHVIDKALDKASGVGGEDYEPARYEGFGPGNAMVIVECLTDNPNRTIGDVRTCFTKTKSKLGTPGSVSHMFDHCAILAFEGSDEEAVLEALMEADVDVTDIENEDGHITVFAPHTEYAKAKQTLRLRGSSRPTRSSSCPRSPPRWRATTWRCSRSCSTCSTTWTTSRTSTTAPSCPEPSGIRRTPRRSWQEGSSQERQRPAPQGAGRLSLAPPSRDPLRGTRRVSVRGPPLL